MNKLVCGLFIILSQTVFADNWLSIKDKSLEIVSGSALDFSLLVESGEAGQHGRIISNNGHLAYSNSPNNAQRFFCASEPYGHDGFPDHATADRYAKQVRLHGYNVARFHFVEHLLMEEQHEDFAFNPEQLDRFYYLLAALKREGVYWILDGMTSWNGAYGNIEDRWEFKYNTKLRVYFDKDVQAHWKRLIQDILNKKNPYTQLTPLQDPALLGVILVNEGGLNHAVNLSSAELSDLHDLGKLFSDWLIKKYGSTNKAFEVWGEGLNSLGIMMARRDWNATPRVRDTQLFYYDLQKDTLNWMTAYLRELGYQGLITAYDNWALLQDTASRAPLSWIDMHAYDDEPSDYVATGSSLKQDSSFNNQLAYIRELAGTRYYHKAFTVSEYDQPFWSAARYETGLAIGAYSSLQNWDLICRHTSAIDLNYDKYYIKPFRIGLDPITRADETLAALLFARGDVKPALHHINLRLTPDYVFNQKSGIFKLPDYLTNISLVTGLSITWQDSITANMEIQPNNPAPTLFDKALIKIKTWLGITNSDWMDLVSTLKQQNLLTETNLTDGKVFQSDTGEIVLDTNKKCLTVNTEKTQAAAFASKLPEVLKNLKIIKSSSPALLSVSSLDNQAITESKRLLLIYATNAQNSGMSFNDAGKVLTNIGTLPVLLKNAKIDFSLTHHYAKDLHLYALRLNGERAVEIPINHQANQLNIDLDLTTYPTTYFELSTE